jgi:hypothetical protein
VIPKPPERDDLKPGECARHMCGHDIDTHTIQACTYLRCECREFVPQAGGSIKPKMKLDVEEDDEAFCTCTHLHADHSAVGCHWCLCRKRN